MWLPRVMNLRFPIFILLIAADIIMGLRNHYVTVPAAVKKGDNVNLICNYDMEGDVLYSVKWYKGKHEFYRYTPKENPAMKVFAASGITVDQQSSNQSQVLITEVPFNNSGKFSCEVSADAPSFHTSVVSSEMEVVELPQVEQVIIGIHQRYRMGDTLRGNCTSDYSKPAANLTWIINDIPANPLQIRKYKNIKDLQKNLESTILGLNFIIQPQHFIRGKLKLRCYSQIYNLYEHPVDKVIEEDHPRILATGTSGHNININFQNQPYDQASSAIDGEMHDQDEHYMTHLKADQSSATPSSKSTPTLNFYNLILVLLILVRIS